MGFETGVDKTIFCIRINHEDIPMGFETWWELGEPRRRSDHEDIPMGFETKSRGWTGACLEWIMKTSLWDLKRC